MEQSCEINYCVKAGTLDDSGLPPIKLPSSLSEISLHLVSKHTMYCPSLLVKETCGYKIMSPSSGSSGNQQVMLILSTLSHPLTLTQISASSISQPVSSNHHDDKDTPTSSTTAALIISSTSLLGLIIVVVIYELYKYKGNKKKVAASSYENLDRSDQISASIPMEPTADV